MSHHVLLLFIALSFGYGCSQKQTNDKIPNGLYLITAVDTSAHELTELKSNEKEIFFSQLFDDYNSEEYLRLVIDTTQYVPLMLKHEPQAVPQTETKKKLLLQLTDLASEKLKVFTANHVMERVALIVDDEALTMHKIREAITGGKLQISRCNDNACERLFAKLKDNQKE